MNEIDITIMGACALLSLTLAFKLLFTRYIRYVGAAAVLVVFAVYKMMKIIDRFNGDTANLIDLGEGVTNLAMIFMGYLYVKVASSNG